MGERPAPRPGVDPLFTDEDAEEILDLLAYDDTLCTGCGHPKVETFDQRNEEAYVGLVIACAGCAARRRAEKKLDDLDGVYSYAVKKPGR